MQEVEQVPYVDSLVDDGTTVVSTTCSSTYCDPYEVNIRD